MYCAREKKFATPRALELAANGLNWPGGDPEKLTGPFLDSCATFIEDCNGERLPKLAVEASLYFARTVRLYQSCLSVVSISSADKATEYVKEARGLLERAIELCKLPFLNASQLNVAVEESLKMLTRGWYESVSAEELAAIKKAMVGGGPRGIATHAGHWYNCVNGHPVRTHIPPDSPAPPFRLAWSSYLPLPPSLPLSTLKPTMTLMILVPVRDRRVWYANGASSLPRVRCPDWRIKSSGCRGCLACYRHGDVIMLGDINLPSPFDGSYVSDVVSSRWLRQPHGMQQKQKQLFSWIIH